ncbi:hypothetical protein AAG747_03215 [Rapidithrix thailandica]|uniref:Copper chaperone NosL n=1 Tax=Rapidithrix thailandica TaxID=413964 RepID=A0AAW9S6B4_9BACT
MKPSGNSRILMALAAVLLLCTFLFPIWRITLVAPQYPDGISMYIWINKITGDTDYTLQNINILNHYVGMKYIEPDTIPELSYFPYVIVGMSLIGLLAAIIRNRYFYLVWVVLLLVLASLGLYDFYLWEYDYGHNLSPNAPIKIPGMAYQPPLIGVKMLLNFEATSLPHLGSLFIGLAMLLGFLAFIFHKKTQTPKGQMDQSPKAVKQR